MSYTEQDVERVAEAIANELRTPSHAFTGGGTPMPPPVEGIHLRIARAALDAMEREPEENPYTGMTIAEAWTVIAEDLRDVLIERQHELEKPDDPLQLAYATLTGVWVEWRSYYVPDYGCYEADAAEVDLVKAGEAIRNAVAAAKGGE